MLQSGADLSASKRIRDRMVEDLVKRGINHQGVLAAISNTPRHLFLDNALAYRAYEDAALPIGNQQTISQPYIVAWMTQAIVSRSKINCVLEIGTGSGYQTAVLAQLVNRVCTMERIGALQSTAEKRLRDLGFRNIEYRHADGFVGWRERSPFDGIIVTAASPELPKMLSTQLAVGGKLVIPVGKDREEQILKVYRKMNNASLVVEQELPVKFVPFLRGLET